MARDELFSFGDEDLGGTEPSWDTEGGSGAIGVLEEPSPDAHVDEPPAEGAWPSRGGSRQRSSEKRQPPPLRLYLVGAAVLLLGSALLLRALIGTTGEEGAPVADSAAPLARAEGPVVVSGERAGFVRASRQKASQAQRARQRRAATRHRSQRRRAHREKNRGGREAATRSHYRAKASTSDSTVDRQAAAPPVPDPPPAPAPPPVKAPPAPEVDKAGGTAASVSDPPPTSPTEAAQGQFGVESAGGAGPGLGG